MTRSELPADARVVMGGLLVVYRDRRHVGHHEIGLFDLLDAAEGDRCLLWVWSGGSAWLRDA